LGTTVAFDSDGDLAVENGRVKLLSDHDSLRQALGHRVISSKGDLLMHPEYGAGLPDEIGVPMSPDANQELCNKLKHILLSEPRVAEVLSVTSVASSSVLTLTASVKTITGDIISNLIFPFPLSLP
jgi:phage baseplate assembly protein W